LGKKKKVSTERIEDFREDFGGFESKMKEVTQEEFDAYRKIKEDGEIPLYEVCRIGYVADINPNKIIIIQDNYSNLCKKFINNNISTKKRNKND